MEVRGDGYRRLAERLQRHRRALGYGAEGCRLYYLQATELLAWLEDRGVGEIAAVRASHIRAYYVYVAERPSRGGRPGALTGQSVAHHVRVIRDLFAWLVAAGELASDPTTAVRWAQSGRAGAGERAALTQDQVARLYAASETTRERAMLSLAYGCGLRAGEVARLDVADVRLRDGLLVVERGKGGRRRTVPLGGGVAGDLGAYLYRDRGRWLRFGDERNPALLIGDRGERMQPWTCNKRLRALGERAEMEVGLSCHLLRHAIATHLLERGLTMQQVQLFLGHRNLETTQVYTHVSGAMLAALVDDDDDITEGA